MEPVAITRAPTPDSYKLAIEDLPIAQIHAELNRLELSERKLRETNAELSAEEYRHEDFAVEAVAENEQVLRSYVWRREIIRDEIQRRGFPDPKRVLAADRNGSHSDGGIEL